MLGMNGEGDFPRAPPPRPGQGAAGGEGVRPHWWQGWVAGRPEWSLRADPPSSEPPELGGVRQRKCEGL